MKAVLVLLFFTALCNAVTVWNYDVYDDAVEDDKDTKSLVEKCTKTGQKCNYSDVLTTVTREQHDLCKMAFDLACSEAQEPIQCAEGQQTAKINGKCENLESDVSKNCCFACKIGRHIKRETGKCADTFSALSVASRIVASKCCNDQDGSDFYNNYETNVIETRFDDDYPAPESLTEVKCTNFNACAHNRACVDSITGPKCECKTGYEETAIGACRDIDECSAGINNCTQLNRKCENLEGSFECKKCLRGFEDRLAYYDDGTDACVDIDECSNNVCLGSEKCTNLIGSHRCTNTKCPPKYKKSGEHECVWRNCDLLQSRICHKTYSFVIKTVSPSDRTSEILKFYATGYTGTFDRDLFEVISEKKNHHVLKLRKPLQRDEKFQLVIRHGRKEHIKEVSVFKSDY